MLLIMQMLSPSSLFYRWTNWGTKSLRNVPGIWAQPSRFVVWVHILGYTANIWIVYVYNLVLFFPMLLSLTLKCLALCILMFSPWEVLLYMLIYWIQPKTMPDSSCIMWVYRMRQTAHKKWAPLSHHSPCSHEGALPAHFVVVQLLSHVWLFATLWTAASQASLSFTVSKSLLKFMPIELVIPPNHLILCHPLLLHSIFPSIRVFSNEVALCIRWPKYWSFNFSISLSNESSRLISFGIDWFDLLAVQVTLKSLLQHHNLKASVLQHSASLWSNSHNHTWLLEKP